jgi:hypothetical protein
LYVHKFGFRTHTQKTVTENKFWIFFRQKASRTEAAKTTKGALKTTGPRVPRKKGVAARQLELTVRRERRRRRRRKRIGRRRGRETRGARAPSLPAGCPPQVCDSRIKRTVHQDVSSQFFLS